MIGDLAVSPGVTFNLRDTFNGHLTAFDVNFNLRLLSDRKDVAIRQSIFNQHEHRLVSCNT